MNHGTFAAYNAGCRCDECKARKSASHRAYRDRNLERENARGKANREKDPEYLKRWRAANPDKARANTKRWADANKAKIAAKSKRWAQANRAEKNARDLAWRKTPRGRVYNANLQHARRGSPLTDEGRDFAVILRGDPCSYCGKPTDTIDHITPISRGGDGDWINLTSACRSCNGRKRTRSLLNFLQELAAA